jgi:hypothetical protein
VSVLVNPYSHGGGGGGPPTDPYFASVVALLHFDGADASTTFTDVTGKTWTGSGNAQLDTAQVKYGTASLLLDGTGDYLSTASHAGFGFGAGDYTVEGWLRQSTQTLARCLFDTRTASNEGIGIYSSNAGASQENKLVLAGSGVLSDSGATTFTANTQTHWAVTRSGTTLRGFIAGVVVSSVTDSRTYASASTAFIGANYLGTQAFEGWIDDVRVTKGVARYTANFTPPSAAHPDS